MKKILIVAALALAFTVPTLAQTPTPLLPTSTQFAAMMTAGGAAIPAGKTITNVVSLHILQNPKAPTTYIASVRTTDGSMEMVPVTAAQLTAAIAAGPTCTVSSPSGLTVNVRGGAFYEMVL